MKPYETEQRKRLLTLLSADPDRFYTADELVAVLCGSGGKLPAGAGGLCSVSTVYRLISRLSEEGVVRKFAKDGSRKFCYQYVKGAECGEHLHLKCESCGKLIHMDGRTSEALLKEILKQNGFSIDETRTLLFGECENCRIGKSGSAPEPVSKKTAPD